MNPSKKQLGFALSIAILIAVVLIIAGGTGYYFYKTPKTPETPEDCEKITDDYKKKQCYIDIAIKTEDISLCKKTIDEDVFGNIEFSEY